MTGDEQALLAAIRANPADDLPRLVAADWYDDHDQPERAELIRVQCAIAGLPEPEVTTQGSLSGRYDVRRHCKACRDLAGEHCRYHALRKREVELAGADRSKPGDYGHNHWEWFAKDFLWADYHTVRRGFVDSVGCSASAWLANGDDVLARHPVEVVRLTDWPDEAVWQTADGASYGWGLANDPNPDWCLPFAETQQPDGGTIAQAVCEARWPGVRFEMPTPEFHVLRPGQLLTTPSGRVIRLPDDPDW